MKEIISPSPKKLDNASLEHIFGGWDSFAEAVPDLGIYAMAASTVTSLALSVSGAVCHYKAQAHRAKGNDKKAQKLDKAAGVIFVLDAVSAGLGVAGVFALASGHIRDIMATNKYRRR